MLNPDSLRLVVSLLPPIRLAIPHYKEDNRSLPGSDPWAKLAQEIVHLRTVLSGNYCSSVVVRIWWTMLERKRRARVVYCMSRITRTTSGLQLTGATISLVGSLVPIQSGRSSTRKRTRRRGGASIRSALCFHSRSGICYLVRFRFHFKFLSSVPFPRALLRYMDAKQALDDAHARYQSRPVQPKIRRHTSQGAASKILHLERVWRYARKDVCKQHICPEMSDASENHVASRETKLSMCGVRQSNGPACSSHRTCCSVLCLCALSMCDSLELMYRDGLACSPYAGVNVTGAWYHRAKEDRVCLGNTRKSVAAVLKDPCKTRAQGESTVVIEWGRYGKGLREGPRNLCEERSAERTKERTYNGTQGFSARFLRHIAFGFVLTMHTEMRDVASAQTRLSFARPSNLPCLRSCPAGVAQSSEENVAGGRTFPAARLLGGSDPACWLKLSWLHAERAA